MFGVGLAGEGNGERVSVSVSVCGGYSIIFFCILSAAHEATVIKRTEL